MHSNSFNPYPLAIPVIPNMQQGIPRSRDEQFILDLEPLECRINSQMLAMLATVSIELKDMVRLALDCYIESGGNRSIDFISTYSLKLRGVFSHMVTSRQHYGARYDMADLQEHFINSIGWIYTILYEHIALALGEVNPAAVIVINNYRNLDDACMINLSIDYLPF